MRYSRPCTSAIHHWSQDTHTPARTRSLFETSPSGKGARAASESAAAKTRRPAGKARIRRRRPISGRAARVLWPTCCACGAGTGAAKQRHTRPESARNSTRACRTLQLTPSIVHGGHQDRLACRRRRQPAASKSAARRAAHTLLDRSGRLSGLRGGAENNGADGGRDRPTRWKRGGF
jgi:hypothetical protein